MKSSIPAGRRVVITRPDGMRQEKKGTKHECLAWIDERWTDMRPLSLRRFTEPAGHVTGNNR